MRIRRILNARLPGQTAPVTIDISEEGRISGTSPAVASPPDAHTIDAGGHLVLPALIDIHLHLDLAYSLEIVPENKSGTLLEAIHLWSEAKRTLTAENVRERAIRAIREEAAYGVGTIRSHVDVGSTAGLRLVEGVLAAREATRDLVDIQLVAFPQDGVLRDPGAIDRMREALKMGVDLVGGIAHHERTPTDSQRQIELIFDLAQEFDRDIDCHIDETDSPASRCVEYLAAETVKRGWQGRVTASHVCALAGYDEPHASKVIGLLAEAGVHVVTNPQVNLHLQGRFDSYPKRRGLTRVRDLMARGVNVSAGQDCICDPFYPLGTGNMLDVAHTLVHADHLSLPQQIAACVDAVTINPAKAMRRTDYGLLPGCRADLVIFPVESVQEAVRLRPRPSAIIRRGRRL